MPKPGETASVPRANLPWISWGLLIVAGVITFRPISIIWETNANYSYGWWIPLICLFLFSERWPTRPPRQPSGLRARLAPLVIVWGVLFFIFRLVAEADPGWRPGLWIFAGLYIAVVLGWLWLYGGKGWLLHFAFPVCFLLLSLPWLFQIELFFVQELMRWNVFLVTGTLRLLAIPAIAEGNVIELVNGRLGVEEACSGILSLQSCIMLSCLLGEVYRLSLGRRLVLVLLAMGLALAGNYGRTLFLALMAASEGMNAVTAWHDTAGYSILLFSGAGAWLACLCLRQASVTQPVIAPPIEEKRDFTGPWRPALFWAVSIFTVAVLSETSTQIWFGLRDAKLTHHPEWTAQMPQTPSFTPASLPETTRETLICDAYKGGSWQDEKAWNWTLFWFRFDPKPANKVVLGWHNPDRCLPSAGLKKDRDYPDFQANLNGIDLNVQPKQFSVPGQIIYVFWVIYPLSGDFPKVPDSNMFPSLATKLRTHLADILAGNRGVGVETLEVAVTGPPNYEAAKAAYLVCLKSLVIPKTPGSPP